MSQERTALSVPQSEEVRRGCSTEWGGHKTYCDGMLGSSLARPVDRTLHGGQWEQGVVVRTGRPLLARL